MAPTILQRIAAGDSHAVDECVEQYGGLIWSLVRRFASVQSDAEDVVQETWLEVWRSAARFDPQVASEAAFVAMIARRRLIDRHRRRIRSIDTTPMEEGTAVATAPVADPVELREEADRVQVAMRNLRDDERRVLELSLMDGLTHSQISDATRLPLGTVKTHARRGLNRLREMLGVTQANPTTEW